MKPPPKGRHVLAGMIFLVVTGAYTYLAALDDRISPSQTRIVAAAIKEERPNEVFPRDPIFGPRKLWLLYTPVFQSLVKMVLVPTGYEHPLLPFRMMVPAVTLVFLCAMYSLLYRQCRSWSVAAFVAVISTRVVHSLGRSHWGMGAVGTMTPAGVYLAVVPLIALAMLRQLGQGAASPKPARVLLLFGLIGLGGNLDLVMALNLTLVLIVVVLAQRRFAPSAWLLALGCLTCAVLGALPYTLYYVLLRLKMASAAVHVDPAAIERAFEIAELAVLYPDVLKGMLNWLALTGVFAILAAVVLSRVERTKTRDLAFWVWFAVGGVFVATVLHGASQAVGKLAGTAPPVIDFIQASSLIMLPIYVLIAQGITNVSRLIRHRRTLRWVLAVLAVAWMLPSDNIRVARHGVQSAATAVFRQSERPRSVRRHTRRREERAELAAIGRWAQDHTGAGAVFLVDVDEFRIFSRRSVVANRNDARTIYYLAPWQLDELMKRVDRQDRLLHPRGGPRFDPESLRFVEELASGDEFQGVEEWYAILAGAVETEDIPQLQQVLPADDERGWGKHYVVYRLKLPPSAGN